MAPKAAGTASKKAGTPSTHPSYRDMIKVAIVNLKDRLGSSRQAIKKYIRSNNDLGATTDASFDKHIAAALNSGEKAGEFQRPKGPSGPVKLAKKDAVKKEVASKSAAPKTAKPKSTTTTTKKPSATKKAAGTTKKAAPKKTTATKANSSKKAAPKKSAPKKPAPAPAVIDKKPTVLAKTKSGRVQKTTAPATAKAAPKKTTTTKKAAPKKSTTPKKAA